VRPTGKTFLVFVRFSLIDQSVENTTVELRDDLGKQGYI
jgi:hypothetical protein